MTVRVYLPESFLGDVRECDPDLFDLWARVEALPRVRRGGGFGRWADLTDAEAAAVLREAEYRAEYWLTDAYGVAEAAPLSPRERSAGKAAQRVAEAILRSRLA